MIKFFRTDKTRIISPQGLPVYMRGVNVGGWLMMEGYFMHAPSLAVAKFKREFAKALGAKALLEFENSFHNTFIREDDFKSIAKSGFNSVRVPFHHGLIEKSPYQYDAGGLNYLDKALAWGKKYGLGIILDLHAAPGAQNHDWHSDSGGEANLWKSKANQKRVFALWEFLADRYKDNPTVLGYDLLNESVIGDPKILADFYKKLIAVIRKVDRNHIIFAEGNRWAQDVGCLENLNDDNLVVSIHFYEPLEFTFTLVPFLKYPLKSGSKTWHKPHIKKRLEEYSKFSEKYKRPIHVGEFGVNYRQGLYGEDIYLRDVVECFNEFGFHWNYWTYKAIKNSMFPDGVYSYYPNSPWVARQGPKTGWDTYASLWPARKAEIIKSWQTANFSLNNHVYEVLKNGI